MGRIRKQVVRLISVVFFLQGALGISTIAVPMFLRNSGLSVRDIAYYNSIVAIPWLFKIVYGIISDSYPIWGLRRKPYLFIAVGLASLGWVLMATLPPLLGFLIAAMIANLGFAMIDVVTDGIVVEHSDATNAQLYQSISWGTRSLGSVISGVLGGYLAFTVDHKLIFLMTACLPLIAGVAVFFYPEERVVMAKVQKPFGVIKTSFTHLFSGDLIWFCLLLLAFSASSSFFTPLFFYMKETLNFGEQFLGILGSIAWGGAVIGCFFYMRFLKRLPLQFALRMAILIGFFEILLCLVIRDYWTAFFIFIMAGILGYISLVPVTSSAAKLAHSTGVESSLYAILMSILNLGQSISTFLGGWLTDMISTQAIIIGAAFVTLLGLPVVKKLKSL